MLYMFIKMSSGWYLREISDIKSYENDIQIDAEEGNIVVISDSIETFCEEFNINEDDIEKV